MRAILCLLSLTLSGCTVNVEERVEQKSEVTLDRNFSLPDARSLLKTTSTCAFSLKLPDGKRLDYKGKAADRHKDYDVCTRLRDGDKVLVERVKLYEVTSNPLTGSRTSVKKDEFWRWTYQDTRGRFL